jgi:phage terminase large subunit-like protein
MFLIGKFLSSSTSSIFLPTFPVAPQTATLYSPENSLDPMSPAAWLKANPAIGSTLDISVLESEAQQPNRNAFLRSSVNLWTASANSWLQPGAWDDLKTSEPMPKGGVLAIEQSQDESRYVGVRAAINPQGKTQVTL